MEARVSSALAAAEFHSLSPPCDHSAETPGPFMPQPGAFAFGRFCQEGLRTGSPLGWVANPRMFSASYHKYSRGLVCEKAVAEQIATRSTARLSRFDFIVARI